MCAFTFPSYPRPLPFIGSWDTVQATPPYLHDYPHATPWVGGAYREGAGWPGFPPSSFNTTSDDFASGNGVAPALLAVDVMQLAENRGFAGGLAAVVEYSGGCTYQVVRGGGGGGGGRVNVHVSVAITRVLFLLLLLWLVFIFILLSHF